MNHYIKLKNYNNSSDNCSYCCLVILSAYNGEQYIEKQILSILDQVGVNVKILIRDDGSTDNTLAILKELSLKYGNKIEIIKGRNVGIHKSFKEVYDFAINNIDFDYIAFSDQDDVWDHDKLRIAIEALKKYSSDFYTCASRLVDGNLVPLNATTENLKKNKFYMSGNSKLLTNGVQGCTIVISRRLYDFIKAHKLPSKYGHDTWIPIISYYFFDCVYDCCSHMSYRQHNSSWTGNRGNKIKQFFVESKHYFKGLSRYKPLALDILNCFSNELNDYDKNVLLAISGKKMNFILRIKAIHKYKFGKFGWKENFVYKIYYLLGV